MRRESWWDFLPPEQEGVRGFQASHFDQLEQTEYGSAWFRSRNEILLWAMARFFPKTRSYLEVGCGTGFVLAAVERERPNWEISGLEPFAQGLGVAARRLRRAELVRADLLNPPWKESFDLVGAYDVLEHMEDDRKALSALRKTLRTDGGILLTVPQHPELWSATDDVARHARRYRPGELELKMRETGFQVAYSTSFVSLPLPAMWFSRRRRPKSEVHCELTLSPMLDWGLGALLGLERVFLKAGFRYPWGGSRLVAARKTEDA